MSSGDIYGSGGLHDLEKRLIGLFTPPLRADQVQRCVIEVATSFADARVRVYLPLLIERAAAAQLQVLVADHEHGVTPECRQATHASSSTRQWGPATWSAPSTNGVAVAPVDYAYDPGAARAAVLAPGGLDDGGVEG